MASVNYERMMVVLNSEKSTTGENNGLISYRRRRRKSSRPQVSPFNSVQDLYRFLPESNVQALQDSRRIEGDKHVSFARNINLSNNLDYLQEKRSLKKDIASEKLPKRRADSDVNESRAKRAKIHRLNHKNSARHISLPKNLDGQEKQSLKRVFEPIKSSDKMLPSEVDGAKAKWAKRANHDVGRDVNPPLPEKFMIKIRQLGYTGDPVLVIQKALYKSDVDKGLQRLSIPVSQVANDDFLTKEEKEMLNDRSLNEAIESILIDASVKEWEISFKKWFMTSSAQYVLISPWNDIVKDNNLVGGMHVQVWSFRMNKQLYFVLVKL